MGIVAAAVLALIVGSILVHNAGVARSIMEREAEASEKKEIALLLDPVRGPPEIDRRLAERMTLRAGMLTLVADPDVTEVFSLPPGNNWLVSCGLGISVSFGAGPDSNAVTSVSDAVPSTEECKAIAPLVGERVRLFLAVAR